MAPWNVPSFGYVVTLKNMWPFLWVCGFWWQIYHLSWFFPFPWVLFLLLCVCLCVCIFLSLIFIGLGLFHLGFVELPKSVGLCLLSNLEIFGYYFFKYTFPTPPSFLLSFWSSEDKNVTSFVIVLHVSDVHFSPQSILSPLFKLGNFYFSIFRFTVLSLSSPFCRWPHPWPHPRSLLFQALYFSVLKLELGSSFISMLRLSHLSLVSRVSVIAHWSIFTMVALKS